MRGIGAALLGVWLILQGLQSLIGLRFAYDYLILAVLAIVAGVFLIIRR